MPSRFRLAGEDFPLAARTLEVAGTAVTLAEIPYTREHLDRVVALRGLRERDWPYWLEDWPATYALAEALAAAPPAPGAGPALDLGCGSGFLAAFLRLRFGLRTFSCDFNADACRLAALNAGLADGASAGRVFCADMHRFPSRARFGLVLCGEMLYARENQAPILAFLGKHLRPGGSAWLADPGRSAAEGFARAAAMAGFSAEIRRAASPSARRNVDVYILRRPGAADPEAAR